MQGASALVDTLTALAPSNPHRKKNAATVEGSLRVSLETQREHCKVDLRKNGGLDDIAIDKWETSTWEPLAEKATTHAMKTLTEAMTRVDDCAGIDKARACIADLSRSERFMINSCPPTLPSDNVAACAFLGVSTSSTLSQITRMRVGWDQRRTQWLSEWGTKWADGKRASNLTIRDAYAYWKLLLDDDLMKDLASHARDQLLRPLSSAVCERVFSYLTQLDTAQRRRMKPALLKLLLFIRANWHIIESLMGDEADAIRAARLLSKKKAATCATAESLRAASKAVKAAAAAAASSCTSASATIGDEDRAALVDGIAHGKRGPSSSVHFVSSHGVVSNSSSSSSSSLTASAAAAAALFRGSSSSASAAISSTCASGPTSSSRKRSRKSETAASYEDDIPLSGESSDDVSLPFKDF